MKNRTSNTAYCLLIVGLIYSGLFLNSCDNAKLPEVELQACDMVVTTYNLNIQPIIETYCSYSGCHDGSSPGTFTNYNGMLIDLEDGDMQERVLELRDMPPSYASGPKEMTPEDYDLLSCWIANGFPEN